MSLASGLIRNLKPSQFGQPVFGSHSHLLSAKELTPGITQLEYHLRRKQLVDSLPDNSIVVAVAAPIKYQSSSVLHHSATYNELTRRVLNFDTPKISRYFVSLLAVNTAFPKRKILMRTKKATSIVKTLTLRTSPASMSPLRR
jgi:hypothetical protein